MACSPLAVCSGAQSRRAGRYTRRLSGVMREIRIRINGTRRLTEPASLAVWCSCVWMALPGPLEYRYLTCARASLVVKLAQTYHKSSSSNTHCTGASMSS